MRRLLCFGLLILTLAISACGGRGEKDKNKTKDVPKPSDNGDLKRTP